MIDRAREMSMDPAVAARLLATVIGLAFLASAAPELALEIAQSGGLA